MQAVSAGAYNAVHPIQFAQNSYTDAKNYVSSTYSALRTVGNSDEGDYILGQRAVGMLSTLSEFLVFRICHHWGFPFVKRIVEFQRRSLRNRFLVGFPTTRGCADYALRFQPVSDLAAPWRICLP
jgi:hypothetical protein